MQIEDRLDRIEKLLTMIWDQQQRAKHLTIDEQFELIPLAAKPETKRGGLAGLTSDQTRWFAEFWGLYWRKVAKVDAAKAFGKRIKTSQQWIECRGYLLAQHPEMMQREPDKRPHAASWLNREDFSDIDALAELQAAEVWEPPKAMSRTERDLLEMAKEFGG